MKRYFASFTVAWLSLIVASAGAASAAANTCVADPKIWADSINRASNERFIPVELWTGTSWDGNRELSIPPVDAEFKHIDPPSRRPYRIKGPVDWADPGERLGGGKTFKVYVRTNPATKDGACTLDSKCQRFAKNDNNSGLGRLYDDRPGQVEKTFAGGLKFPLGLWKENEPALFRFEVWRGDSKQASQRTETITVKKLDFSYANIQHCLEFEWLLEEKNKTIKDGHNYYIYCPCKSMVSVKPVKK